jgi:hypothetical protein
MNRVWLKEFLFYHMSYADIPLYYKLQGTGLWFVSYVWIWQIYHKTVSLFGKVEFLLVKNSAIVPRKLVLGTAVET